MAENATEEKLKHLKMIFRKVGLRGVATLGVLLAMSLSAVPGALAQEGPTIDVWYGLDQAFGLPGEPQIWCDIGGNVSDPDGVLSLSYTLNGGSPVTMTVGPDGRRLINQGDFVVDLRVADLLTGANSVVITATDNLDNVSQQSVTLTYDSGNSWPTTYNTDWGSLTVDGDPQTPDPAILEQAHVVDGNWTVEGDSIRTVEPGYDRLIALGELDWRDYEVTVPFTVHEIMNPSEWGVGLIFRWNGHTNDPDYCDQPLCGWKPLGDIGWVTQNGLNIWDYLTGPTTSFPTQLNTAYWMKMRVETLASGATYNLKVWEVGQPEPVSWNLTRAHGDDFPMSGSLLLVAHQADASFGNVSIVPINSPNDAPVANNDLLNAKFNGTTFLDVLANDTDSDGIINPASVNIISDPTGGTIVGIDPLTGLVEYLHGGGVNVSDTFTYTVEDNDGATSNIATVNLDILPNAPPTANNDAATVKIAESVAINVPKNDTDSDGALDLASIVIVSDPVNGTITNINPVTGRVTYLQDGAVAPSDSFTYTINDLDGATSNVATVLVTIVPNEPPTANDDAAFVSFNGTSEIDVLNNDADPDGSLLPGTLAITDPPFNGTAIPDPLTGIVTYTHTALTAEPDSFTYVVQDNNGELSNLATVRITVGSPPPANFYSDDFNSCGVDPMWDFVNPQGDSPEPAIVGAFSGDSRVTLAVPAGSNHQPYDDYLGAPYLVQAAPDKDFTLEVKFSSTLPDTGYALQGILVRQDDLNWMRFDFYSNKNSEIIIYGTTNIKDDSFVNEPIGVPGDAPLYMRVVRTGDDWDLYYKTDLIPWTLAGSDTHALTVTGVGVFAGNAGGSSAPPFTAYVDYFSNAVDPVADPDDQDQNSLTVTISGGGSVDISPDQAVYACGDPVDLTATADLDWVFTGWSGDLSGTDNPATISMERARFVTANFAPTSGTVIAANTTGVTGISTTAPCAAGIPVEILRDVSSDIRGFTVTVDLTDLDLCDGTASIIEGDYLSGIGGTTFQVIDNLDGSYDIDATINGEPCGANALTGTLFTLDVTNTIPDGTGTIAVTAVELRDCVNAPVAAAAGAPGDILIDTTAPTGVTDLVFSKVPSGNPAGHTTGVNLAWTPSVDPEAAGVKIYRKGFGTYPEYDDDGGAAPSLPGDPVAEGWELVTTVPVGSNTAADLTPVRNYWYFCALAVDAVGNPSPAVMASGGVLNYLLGDVAPATDGDNKVWTDDLTLLGSRYGTSVGDAQYLNTLDIGPTSDLSVNGLPTTDNQVEFEDLILFGINYGADAGPGSPAVPLSFPQVPGPAAANIMALHLPDLPPVGQTFEAELVMAGNGQIQGLRIPLVWDSQVVKPVTFQGGPLLTEQGGTSLVLSADPGVIDVCLAGLRDAGISGTGRVASVTFEVLAAGDPQIQMLEIDARDQTNGAIMVTTTAASPVDDGGELPAVSALYPNYPNPFNPMTTIAFDLAVAGPVRIDIFSIDGRRVRSLVNAEMSAGRHTEMWDGRDSSGRAVSSGTYLYIMETPGLRQTQRMLLVK